MFFEDEEHRIFDPDLFHVVHRQFYTINCDFEVARYRVRSVPTHTEDGIPIRKLYVTNLPPKTTRTELFGVFTQYGLIKSCWIRMGEIRPNRIPSAAYAFVTFNDPADAHKALQAPNHEKTLRGRNLRISPADSWHQPAEDADGQVVWKSRGQRREESNTSNNDTNQQEGSKTVCQISGSNSEATTSTEGSTLETTEEGSEDDVEYTMIDILNTDCISNILQYIPFRDLIRSERVSKRWRSMVQEYLQGLRLFKTSWWQHGKVVLTTAILRQLLRRFGGSLVRLHIDHKWSALNDRTAHTIGRFCPNLEELKVDEMNTKNWNPLIYGCKRLKHFSFLSCSKITDASLMQLVKSESPIESLTVTNNTHVTGLFLAGSNPPKLTSLTFCSCYSIQGTVLCAALDTLRNITTLKLDDGPVSLWKIIPAILEKLPKLEELSLSKHMSIESIITEDTAGPLCKAIGTLTELKSLTLSRNLYISNAVLKEVAKTCVKLQHLNVSCCNSRKNLPQLAVSDEGIIAVCNSLTDLKTIDVSYLSGLTDAGMAAVSSCTNLRSITARGISTITAVPFIKCLKACHLLKVLDICGCNSVSTALIEGAISAVESRPRPLLIRLAGTAAAMAEEAPPIHKQLIMDIDNDLCDPQLRPDFIDRIYDSSDDSFDDIYDRHALAMEDILVSDEEDFIMEDEWMEFNDDDALYHLEFGIHSPDLILL